MPKQITLVMFESSQVRLYRVIGNFRQYCCGAHTSISDQKGNLAIVFCEQIALFLERKEENITVADS